MKTEEDAKKVKCFPSGTQNPPAFFLVNMVHVHLYQVVYKETQLIYVLISKIMKKCLHGDKCKFQHSVEDTLKHILGTHPKEQQKEIPICPLKTQTISPPLKKKEQVVIPTIQQVPNS